MPKVRVAGFGVSLDGFGAGSEQSLNDPLGKRGQEIFQWFFHTKTGTHAVLQECHRVEPCPDIGNLKKTAQVSTSAFEEGGKPAGILDEVTE